MAGEPHSALAREEHGRVVTTCIGAYLLGRIELLNRDWCLNERGVRDTGAAHRTPSGSASCPHSWARLGSCADIPTLRTGGSPARQHGLTADSGRALDFNAYHDAAIRIATTGTPYARESRARRVRTGTGRAPRSIFALSIGTHADHRAGRDEMHRSWWSLSRSWSRSVASCALMPVRPRSGAFAFAILAIEPPCSEGTSCTAMSVPCYFCRRW